MELRNKYESPSHHKFKYNAKPQEIIIFTGEDLDECPPKLPPISGVLAPSEVDHPIVRPVAHRPPLQLPPSIWSSPSTGYGSGSGSCCSDARSLSFLEDPEHGASSDESLHCESPRCVGHTRSKLRKSLWGSTASGGRETSGRESVDADTILREKMAEISLLRQTLEENEQVIVKVYAEKEQLWQSEIERVKKHYENKLEELRQETAKQILKCTAQIKPANKTCNCQNAIIPVSDSWHLPDRDTNSLMPNRRQSLALPACNWTDKNLHNINPIRKYESKSSLNRSCLLSTSVCSLNEYEEEVKNSTLSEEERLRFEVEALRIELSETKKDLQRERDTLREDHKRWKEERDRVSTYQEQLHQNYIQAWKRGRVLESQLQATKSQLDKFINESQC